MLMSIRPIVITLSDVGEIFAQCHKLMFYPIQIFGFQVDLYLVILGEILLGLVLKPFFRLFSSNGD